MLLDSWLHTRANIELDSLVGNFLFLLLDQSELFPWFRRQIVDRYNETVFSSWLFINLISMEQIAFHLFIE